eukprot:g19886.t1
MAATSTSHHFPQRVFASSTEGELHGLNDPNIVCETVPDRCRKFHEQQAIGNWKSMVTQFKAVSQPEANACAISPMQSGMEPSKDFVK